jgi:hypothetical protein
MGLFTGNIDDRSAKQLATVAIRDAEEQIHALDTNSDYPDDERLAGASIEYLDVSKDYLTLEASILLTNVAGTVVRLMVPVIDKLTSPYAVIG